MGETSPGATAGPIRIAVVEEHEIVRYGLVASLAEDRGLEVRAADADTIDGHVDIAIVSSEAAMGHRFPCPIIVCSDKAREPRSAAAGNNVAGVLSRGSLTAAQLRATVHAVAAGLLVNAHDSAEPTAEALDARALRLLELIAEGHSTREIADAMSYSERTIKKLITGLESHMQARSRAQVVAEAIRRGLI